MATPISQTVTIRDVLRGLESVEEWVRQLREALATIDPGQRLEVKPQPLVAVAPRVSAGLCAPPPPPTKKPSKKKTKK